MRIIMKSAVILILFIMSITLVFTPILAQTPVATPVEAAEGLLSRLLPSHVASFAFEEIAQIGGKDVFEIESVNGIITLRGSNGLSMVSALNWYLKYYANAHTSWYQDQLNLPNPLPIVPTLFQKVTPYEYRYNFNSVAFSYSTAFWDWERWEKEIDWMALNGINAPLALTGQNATWKRVYAALGLSNTELDEFFAGPAYVPFHLLGLVNGFGGPLPQSWLDASIVLQQNILQREREFGMTPILGSFAGHIPEALPNYFPGMNFTPSQWVGFPIQILDPLDPMFQVIADAFLTEQTAMYGTDHLYAVDTFIELPAPPPALLPQYSSAVYNGITNVDPLGIWLMQNWAFTFQNWSANEIQSFLSPIPDDRLIILDLTAGTSAYWKTTQAYYGKKWIWGSIVNFGGVQGLGHPMNLYAQNLPTDLNDPLSGNLSGIGAFYEGMGENVPAWDLFFEMGWRNSTVNRGDWLQDYARRRYGLIDPVSPAMQGVLDSWAILAGTAYNGYAGGARFITPANTSGSAGNIAWDRDHFYAFEKLLGGAGELGSLDTYQYDLANLGRQVIANMSHDINVGITSGYNSGDMNLVNLHGNRMLGAIQDMDELLLTRPEFLLGSWLEDAKALGSISAEKLLYEWNARTQITLWGDRYTTAILRDYARKEWSGLLNNFYYKRWELYLTYIQNAVSSNTNWASSAYDTEIKDFEEAWAFETTLFPATPSGSTVTVANALLTKYAPLANEYYGLGLADLGPNLAGGKPTSAQSTILPYTSDLAVDALASSYWAADPYPAWWQVDLESVQSISTVRVANYYDGTRYYHYTISESTDGSNWTQIADKTNNNPATASGDIYIVNTTARYLRVNMLYNSANSGVHITDFNVAGGGTPPPPPPENIALNQPATAQNVVYGFVASNAVDSDPLSYWATDPYPAWWQVDLGANYDVTLIRVTNYYDGTRYYHYDVQSSLDGSSWTTEATKSNNNIADAAGDTYNVSVIARYLRVNMTFNSANPGIHIRDFHVEGTPSGG